MKFYLYWIIQFVEYITDTENTNCYRALTSTSTRHNLYLQNLHCYLRLIYFQFIIIVCWKIAIYRQPNIRLNWMDFFPLILHINIKSILVHSTYLFGQSGSSSPYKWFLSVTVSFVCPFVGLHCGCVPPPCVSVRPKNYLNLFDDFSP